MDNSIFKEFNLEKVEDIILKYKLGSIVVKTKPAGTKLPTGSSKFGGFPDVNVDFKWPDKNGEKLSFICQFNLNDIKSYIPSDIKLRRYDGLISIFYLTSCEYWGYLPSHKGAWAVYYFEPGNLLQISSPNTRNLEIFKECALEYSQSDTFMPYFMSEKYFLDQLSEEEKDGYMELVGETNDFRHQLFGHYKSLQNDDLYEQAHAASHGFDCGNGLSDIYKNHPELNQDVDNWRLLFQLDYDDNAGIELGDAMLYFVIEKERLEKLDFSNVWCNLESL